MNNKKKQPIKKTTPPKEEVVLTRDKFFGVLNLVTRPVNEKKQLLKKERNIGVTSFRMFIPEGILV